MMRKVIPLIRYSSKLEGLDEKVLSLKLSNYSKDFKQSLEQVLSLYPESELKYSSKLVAFVMHEVERYILKPKAGEAKRALVVDCCRKYFDFNDGMVGVVIDLLFKELSQVKFISRQLLKFARFFLKSQSKSFITQQTIGTTLRILTNQGVLSKRIVMFYETFDLIKILKIICTNPQHILVWFSKLGAAKWLVIVIIVAF